MQFFEALVYLEFQVLSIKYYTCNNNSITIGLSLLPSISAITSSKTINIMRFHSFLQGFCPHQIYVKNHNLTPTPFFLLPPTEL